MGERFVWWRLEVGGDYVYDAWWTWGYKNDILFMLKIGKRVEKSSRNIPGAKRDVSLS